MANEPIFIPKEAITLVKIGMTNKTLHIDTNSLIFNTKCFTGDMTQRMKKYQLSAPLVRC